MCLSNIHTVLVLIVYARSTAEPSITLFILDTGKQILKKTVETQMKCRIWCISSASALFANMRGSRKFCQGFQLMFLDGERGSIYMAFRWRVHDGSTLNAGLVAL